MAGATEVNSPLGSKSSLTPPKTELHEHPPIPISSTVWSLKYLLVSIKAYYKFYLFKAVETKYNDPSYPISGTSYLEY